MFRKAWGAPAHGINPQRLHGLPKAWRIEPFRCGQEHSQSRQGVVGSIILSRFLAKLLKKFLAELLSRFFAKFFSKL